MMLNFATRRLLPLLTIDILLSVLAIAQQQPSKIPVHAPFAQALVLKTKAAHPEIHKLGIHAVPPGETDSAIIANNIPAKIGKRSSAKDLQHLATGQPWVTKISKEGIYDLLLPLADQSGSQVGFTVMEIPLNRAADEQNAVQKAVAVRDEIRSKFKISKRYLSNCRSCK